MKTRRGRKPVVITLGEDERETLERWARRPSTPQGLAMRSRIVLAAADGRSNVDIAADVGCSGVTVSKWRGRFARGGVDALADAPRPGPPRSITDAKVEEVIVATLEETPADATHWSTRSMAKRAGLSQSSIHRIWRAFGLQPHRTQHFKVSPDPLFTEKVRDLVGLYLNPPDAAVVLCVDHKSQIQALDRTAPILPLLPGVPQRATHDYKRCGTTNLHAALDTASGNVITHMTARNRTEEFRNFLNLINREVPPELDVHVILDNASTHKTEPIRRWLQRHPRFTFHYTPTYASWMNLVERWFSELTTKHIRRSTHRSVQELTDSINQWTKTWNQNPTPYTWHKTADEIFDTIANYLQRFNESGH